MDDKKIKEQAKGILDSFVEELDKVQGLEEARVEREEDRRKENGGKDKCDSFFREKMLNNSKNSRDGYIKSSKGKWVK